MKPSERIKEIQRKLFEEHRKGCFAHDYEPCGTSLLSCKPTAIQMYLDEVYEAENSAREQLKKNLKPM